MNGNFTLLLTSSGQECQYLIATDIQWTTMAISYLMTSSHQEWQFHIALLTSSGQEWQFHTATDI